MKKYSILHICLNSEDYKLNYPMRTAFQEISNNYIEIDWINLRDTKGINYLREYIKKIVKETKFDFCFMQIQTPNIIDVETAKVLKQNTFTINWSGDVRKNIDWYIEIGKEIDLTLFTNEYDVNRLKQLNIKSDYLQIGFDNITFNHKPNINRENTIIFCANNYKDRNFDFPLSDYRIEVVQKLKEYYKENFLIFGNGWEKYGISTQYIRTPKEGELYKKSKIGINLSHFNYSRYSSDRMFRQMGGGLLCLSHNYIDIEKDFKIKENIDVFNDINDLKQKIDYYLNNDNERLNIANNGFNLVHSKCTWNYRLKELLKIIESNEKK